MYSGMIDCGRKIFHAEGVSGLYRGFWISSVQIVSGVFYISTYEGVRHLLSQQGAGNRVKSLVAGGAASLVGQTIIVPFDVISQHVMVLGMNRQNGTYSINPLGIDLTKSKTSQLVQIAREIMKRDGFAGFYRGYIASLSVYVPNSALWWGFYHFYQGLLPYRIKLNHNH
jgi:solute carrier family 25 protein 44